MYVGQLILTQQTPFHKDTVSDAISTMLSALRMNGQICGREWPIAVTPTGYDATVLLPEETSLDAGHHNDYVRKALQKLRDAGLTEPEVRCTKDLDGLGICDCERRTVFILFTDFLSLEPPVRCGSCFRPVPLYRIPPLRNDEYNEIISWQSCYQSCDSLQMGCGVMERGAMRQLSRYDSRLSQDGLAICRTVHEAMQMPTYYYLYRYGARSRRQEQKRLCPSCHGEWLLPTPWHIFDFKCDRCHLVSNIAWDVR